MPLSLPLLLQDSLYLARVRVGRWRQRLGLARLANQAVPGLGAADIAAHAAYAWSVAFAQAERVRAEGRALQGAALLELGPGANFGACLALADLVDAGRVVVCDRFLTPWNDDYHPRVYTALAERMEAAGVAAPRVRAAAQGHGAVVEQHQDGIEKLPDTAPRFALTVSQAVLEHVADLPRTFRTLYRVTQPGGLGLHQVDFRYHGDFSQPLALARRSKACADRLIAASRGECGTWFRVGEMARMVTEAGFSLDCRPTDHASPEQIAQAWADIDPGRGLSEADLAITSALLVLRKA